jgi:hypothetical protein
MKLLLDWQSFSDDLDFVNRYAMNEAKELDENLERTKILVSGAITQFTGQFRFFSTLLYKLQIVYARHREIPVAATDGTHLFINPDFFAQLDILRVKFILAHEVLHCALLHFARQRERNHLKWNYATDYEINLLLLISQQVGSDTGILTESDILGDPLNGLLNVEFMNMSAEQIYDDPRCNPPAEKPEQKEPETGEGSGESELNVGDVIYDSASGKYGVVNSIDQSTGDVDFSEISESEAKKLTS